MKSVGGMFEFLSILGVYMIVNFVMKVRKVLGKVREIRVVIVIR